MFDIDIESIAFNHPHPAQWQAVIHYVVDWMEGRETGLDPVRAGRKRAWRERSGQYALDYEHEYCDNSKLWAFHSILRAQRPGAVEPWERCHGCALSYITAYPSRRIVNIPLCKGGLSGDVRASGAGIPGRNDQRPEGALEPGAPGGCNPRPRRRILAWHDDEARAAAEAPPRLYTDRQLRRVKYDEIPVGSQVERYGVNEDGRPTLYES